MKTTPMGSMTPVSRRIDGLGKFFCKNSTEQNHSNRKLFACRNFRRQMLSSLIAWAAKTTYRTSLQK
jgi:hypothetical protein